MGINGDLWIKSQVKSCVICMVSSKAPSNKNKYNMGVDPI